MRTPRVGSHRRARRDDPRVGGRPERGRDGLHRQHAPQPARPVHHDPRLDVGVQHHRERVLQRGPPIEQRRHRGRERGGERARCWDLSLVDPADRVIGRVEEKEVGERVRERPGPRLTCRVPDPGGHHRLERELAHPCQREPLEPAIGTDEVGHEPRRRGREDLGGGRELLQVPADLHHRDEVPHLDRLVDVVGDEQDRLGQLRLEPQELVLEPLADDRVHGAERLVHEHERRIGREGARHSHALPLAAGELGRVAVAVERRVEADERQQLLGARPLPRRGPPEQARHDGHVGADRLVREEAHLLDDIADLAPELGRVAAGHVRPVDQDAAARRLDEPVDHLEARGLAAAGRADEHADLAGRDGQRQVVDGPRRPARGPGRGIALRDVLVLDDHAPSGGRLRHARRQAGPASTSGLTSPISRSSDSTS